MPYRDKAWLRQHYELVTELLQSVPSAEPVVPWDFETWLERTLRSPDLLPEGYFTALEGERQVECPSSGSRAARRPSRLG